MRSDNEEQFITWLVTQKNARGTLYLERVARRYALSMRSAPQMLNLSQSEKEINIYNCQTVADFNRLYHIFINAPNFRDINSKYDHGAFSAGLAAYKRYLEHLEKHNDEKALCHTVLCIVDFTRPELCSSTDPVECTINNTVLHKVNWNWRDLLVEITEYLLKTIPEKVQSFSFRTGKQFMTKQKPPNCVCRQLSNKQFVVVSYEISHLVRIIGKLCNHCGIDRKNVVISYVPKKCQSSEIAEANISSSAIVDDILELSQNPKE